MTTREEHALAAAAGQDFAAADELLRLYEQMEVIRRTEKAAHDLFLSGLVKGTTHLAAGHEAVAVGASAALRPGDYVFATYRGHHHAIARGATPGECLAELMSKATGPVRGQGRVDAPDQRRPGCSAPTRSSAPTCRWRPAPRGRPNCGAPVRSRWRFFGDGATNIGAFHEALNLAAVWKLPVLFVCENNLYMEYTPIGAVTAVATRRPTGPPAYGLPADGHRRQRRGRGAQAVALPRERARAGDGPTMIEARDLPALSATAAPTRRKYRPAEEVQRMDGAGPGPVAPGPAASAGVPRRPARHRRGRSRRGVAAAVAAGQGGSAARSVAAAFTDVWADGGSAGGREQTHLS